ncbi:unnamed protein product, partial [Polarella glacialis]
KQIEELRQDVIKSRSRYLAKEDPELFRPIAVTARPSLASVTPQVDDMATIDHHVLVALKDDEWTIMDTYLLAALEDDDAPKRSQGLTPKVCQAFRVFKTETSERRPPAMIYPVPELTPLTYGHSFSSDLSQS